MKRNYRLICTLILVLLAQTACTFSADILPTPTSPAPTLPAATAVEPSMPADTVGCPTETADAKLYRNDADGYCLLYPSNFIVVPPRFIVFNPTNAPGDKLGDAVIDIRVEPANGRTAEQVAGDAIAGVGPGFNIKLDQFVVDDTRAFVVDGLPGPDPLRNVYVVSNDRLYTFTFMPWGQSRELDSSYEWIMKTLHFLPPTQ